MSRKRKGNLLPQQFPGNNTLISNQLFTTENISIDYFNRLQNIAMTIFEWENLPDNLPQRFIEKVLFYEGKVGFFLHETRGFLACRCTQSGELNIYDDPIYWNFYTYYDNFQVPNESCVIIRNNRLLYPTINTIAIYAQKLANVDMSINVNINNQKTPFFLEVDESQKLDMENMFKKVQYNEPYIFTRKNNAKGVGSLIEAIKIHPINPPFVSDKLTLYKHDVFNELYTFLGINNSNVDKKERLVTDEASSNREQIEMNVNSMLKTRQEACEEINKKWYNSEGGYKLNYPISVRLKKYDVEDIVNQFKEEINYG